MRGSLDDEIYMAVRTPAQLRAVLAADHLDEGQAAVIKTGLFNDGIMASESDLGTYTDRSRELSYQDEVCLTVPNGGEVVSDTVYNDVENAMNTLQTMHVSYLNRMYDEKVLKKWKNQPYEDTTGYDYIGAHLGYRYEISGTAFSYKMFGQTAQLTLSVKIPALHRHIMILRQNCGYVTWREISYRHRIWVNSSQPQHYSRTA